MRRPARIALIATAVASVVTVVFQNCSPGVVLTPTQQLSTRTGGEISFCSGEPGGDVMQMSNFIFVNLTAHPTAGRLLSDSDADGVADDDETMAAAVSPRASGILDRICKIQGGSGCTPAVCQLQLLALGLTQCDSAAYSATRPLTGLDTDSDGLPDLIEILRGLDPLRDDDATAAVFDRIQAGLDPKSEQRLASENQIQYALRKMATSDACQNQDRYTVSLIRYPVVDTKAVSNEIFPQLSHAEHENVYIALIVSRPINTSKRPKIYYSLFKSGSIDTQDFKLLGEIQ